MKEFIRNYVYFSKSCLTIRHFESDGWQVKEVFEEEYDEEAEYKLAADSEDFMELPEYWEYTSRQKPAWW
jgi:hypothetical protein